jgi:glyoxalase family protein
LKATGTSSELDEGSLVFADPEGLEHALVVSDTSEEKLSAAAPDIPVEHALQGFDGVRAYTADPARSAEVLGRTLGFESADGHHWNVRGEKRTSFYAYDLPATDDRPKPGAGTVHHVAFASQLADEEAWRSRVADGGAHPTPVIERFYFRSVYFREPSGVLFEIATIGPGFAVDEDAAHLGERLSLPPRFESLREQLEATLTPLGDPRAGGTIPSR